MTRVFIRWKWHKWSKWHIKDNRRPGWTLCGLNYSLEYEVTDLWVLDCSKCEHKRRQEEA